MACCLQWTEYKVHVLFVCLRPEEGVWAVKGGGKLVLCSDVVVPLPPFIDFKSRELLELLLKSSVPFLDTGCFSNNIQSRAQWGKVCLK